MSRRPVGPGHRADPKARRAALIAAGGFLGLALLATAAWAASNLPYTPLARPDVLAAESVRLMQSGRPGEAEAIVRRELDLRPDDASAWCRLAAAKLAVSRGLNPEVQDLLQRSYAASAIDVDAFAWRGALVFNHWSDVSPSLRQAAVSEVRAMDGVWETKPQVEKLTKAVRDPTGRLALALTRAP